ncbi:MAG: glycosyltransferase [Flavobacteriales bacterium]|nr:glycosyltransferase [Flavobacteriales bacterium]
MNAEKITKSKKVVWLCSGLDSRRRRGYEQSTLISHKRMLAMGVSSWLLKGSSEFDDANSETIGFVHRWKLWRYLGDAVGEAFMFEYLFFSIGCLQSRKFRNADVLCTQEPFVARMLLRLRQVGGLKAKTRIVFVCGVTMNAKFVARFGDLIFVVNPEVFSEAKRWFPSKPIFWTPNPIDFSKRYVSDEQKLIIHNNPFPPVRKSWIVVVGAINKSIKRTHLIVDAWKKYGQNYGLCLVGQIQDDEILRDIPKDAAFIHAYVAPEEVSRYIYYADVVCLASKYEGFPNIVLECVVNGKIPFLQKNNANTKILLSEKYLVDFEDELWIKEITTSSNNEIAHALIDRFEIDFASFVETILIGDVDSGDD